MGGIELQPIGFTGSMAGVRTYIGSFTNAPPASLVSAEAMPAGPDRRAAAFAATSAVSSDAMQDLRPALEQLRVRGIVAGYRVYEATGQIAIDVNESQAALGWRELNALPHLGQLARNRAFQGVGVEQAASAVGQLAPAATVPGRVATNSVGAVNADDAWKTGARGQGVVVGIIDTGVDASHSFLASAYRGARVGGAPVHDYNWFDVFGSKVPVDDHSHGTHVTGTVVGSGQLADKGQVVPLVTGVAPEAQWIATRMMSSKLQASTEQVIAAINWMVAPTDSSGRNSDPRKAPDIINSSWIFTNEDPRPYVAAFDAVKRAGIVSVVAAGNSGPGPRTVGEPAAFASNIAVAATDRTGTAAPFSARGPGKYDSAVTGTSKPDVAAPGVDIYSSIPGNRLASKNGTSMAAPVVAGVAALVLSRYPSFTPDDVRRVLESSAIDAGLPGRDHTYGAGRVDAVRALAAADTLARTRGLTRAA